MRSLWAILVVWCVALAGGQHTQLELRTDPHAHHDAHVSAALDAAAPIAARRHTPRAADRHAGGSPVLAPAAPPRLAPCAARAVALIATSTSFTPAPVPTRSSRGPPSS